MKKITILFAFIALAAFAMAQASLTINPDSRISTKNEFFTKEAVLNAHAKAAALQSKGLYFHEDFEGAVNWTFGADVSDKLWQVTDDAGFSQNLNDYSDNLGEYSTTGNAVGGHWAWIDIVSDIAAIGGPGIYLVESYIQFDNIDLTGVNHPQIGFYQIFRRLNTVRTWLDFSTDGGTSWTSLQINELTENNGYADLYFARNIGDYVANEANVSIRFRWSTYDIPANNQAGYGWQIDDIVIVDNPMFDIGIADFRVNFFYGVDYTVPGNEDLYHLSSHYGQVPAEQYTSNEAVKWFNVAVENHGAETVVPIVDVTVLDPNNNVVFTAQQIGTALAALGKDTIDVVDDFLLENPIEGRYNVAFEVSIQGEDDEWIFDNLDTAFFYVTNGIFARDAGVANQRVGLSNYSFDHMDGDMMATNFWYLYPAEIVAMRIYIHEDTDPGVSILTRLFAIDEDTQEWVNSATGTFFTIEEEHLGEWVEIEFIGGAFIDLDSDGVGYVRAAIEIFYDNGELDFYISGDNRNKYSGHGYNIYLAAEDSWYYFIERGLTIQLIETPGVETPVNELANNIAVYPNPTTGILNIDNVKGANVEIFNIMGQAVESIYNANEFNTVDISNYANGTYIVRVIDGNNVNTFKINLVD